MGLRQLTPRAIAQCIRRGEISDGVPTAHVAPLTGKGEHADVAGALHHRVVNGLAAAGGKHRRVGTNKKPVLLGCKHGLAAHRQNVGRVGLQGVEQGLCLDQKDTRVPQVLAAGQEFHRLVSGRLLNETSNLTPTMRSRTAFLYVPISRAGVAG